MRDYQRNTTINYILFFAKFVFFPLSFYFFFFILLTFPLILFFSTHLYADMGDGLQNVWNLWWVNKAVTELHQSIWKTNLLHYPYGTTLIGHTLNPFNGLMGIFLLNFFSLFQTYNIIFIFTFVTGGISAFILAYYLTKSYFGSIIAGYIFTFSNYHFAHAEGHLQTISLEFIPLFVLCWWLFMKKTTVITALASAVTLYFIILCDYYFFFYCILVGIIIYLWQVRKKKDIFFLFRKKNIISTVLFSVITCLTSGIIVLTLFIQNKNDPFTGSHPDKLFSADLLAFIVPGGHWRFSALTKNYWTNLPGNIHENSISIGISVLIILIWVWFNRIKIRTKYLPLWYFILFFFAVMSLGPVLYIWGKEVYNGFMPYLILKRVFPFLSLSGVPVRMMVVVILAAAIIFAGGFDTLFRGTFVRKLCVLLIVGILFIEYFPRSLTLSKPEIPSFVKYLKELPDKSGVLDLYSDEFLSLYYQTIHQKPLAFGYLARIPKSVMVEDFILRLAINNHDYKTIYKDYGFRYLLSDKLSENEIKAKIIYKDDKVLLYDFADGTIRNDRDLSE